MYNVKVIPPIEFRRMKSREVPKNEILKNIVHRNSTKITLGESAAYDLWYESYSKMKFGKYEEMAKKAETRYTGMSVKQREDAYWANISKRDNNKKTKLIPVYAIDNNISLFPETFTHWNLSKFTCAESIIHMVCI